MELELDPRSPVPLYLQIAGEVRRWLALGALQPGDRLPTVRELAVQARVNRNTAARAIQHLEGEGVVRTRVGQGTFVLDGRRAARPARIDERLDRSIDRLVVEAHGLGLPLDGLAGRVARRVEVFTGGRGRGGGKREKS